MESKTTPTIHHLADFTPPLQDRAWSTSPHPNLPIVATCGADRTVRIYSLLNFTLLSTISGGHKRSVRSCAWKPHAKGESVLATASFDATVGIWKRWNGFETENTEDVPMPGGLYGNGEAAEDENGNEDEEEWGFAVLLDGHDSEVKSVSWSPAGSLLATCSRDKSIWIWEDLDDGDNNFETVAVLQEHSGDVKCVAWHPNEECLASGSYDDTIRLWREDIDDWGQIACLRGHEGTVWCIDWESGEQIGRSDQDSGNNGSAVARVLLDKDEVPKEQRQLWVDLRFLSGPRLVSCSDDKTIRIWRKESPDQQPISSYPTNTSIPSTIRPAGTDETWVEENQLPCQHDLSVYSVVWSKRTGLIASTGADGKIVVYQECFWATQKANNNNSNSKQDSVANEQATDASNGNSSKNNKDSNNNILDQGQMDVESSVAEGAGQVNDGDSDTRQRPNRPYPVPETKWRVLTSIDAAHGIHEVNQVCWAKRADYGKKENSSLEVDCESLGGKDDGEEVLISTGDDGVVKAWRILPRS